MSRWRVVKSLGEVPARAGCYALVMKGRAVYVGSTVDLPSRLRQHGWKLVPHGVKTPRWGIVVGGQVKIRPSLRLGDWLTAEWRLIRKLRPAGNKAISSYCFSPEAQTKPIQRGIVPGIRGQVTALTSGEQCYTVAQVANAMRVGPEVIREMYGRYIKAVIPASIVRPDVKWLPEFRAEFVDAGQMRTTRPARKRTSLIIQGVA